MMAMVRRLACVFVDFCEHKTVHVSLLAALASTCIAFCPPRRV